MDQYQTIPISCSKKKQQPKSLRRIMLEEIKKNRVNKYQLQSIEQYYQINEHSLKTLIDLVQKKWLLLDKIKMEEQLKQKLNDRDLLMKYRIKTTET